jgi:hypothetical protein
MGTKSRDRLYGSSVRMVAERAAEARREADRFAREAWNKAAIGLPGSRAAVADACQFKRLRPFRPTGSAAT